jgi:hypothetical protein
VVGYYLRCAVIITPNDTQYRLGPEGTLRRR